MEATFVMIFYFLYLNIFEERYKSTSLLARESRQNDESRCSYSGTMRFVLADVYGVWRRERDEYTYEREKYIVRQN